MIQTLFRVSILIPLLVGGLHLPCASAQPIVLAHIGPFSGPLAEEARALNVGMQAFIRQANAQGGIAGRPLQLITLDDRFDKVEFLRQFGEARTQKAIALLSPLGLDAMAALLEEDLLGRNEMVVINGLPGATPFRSPGHPNLFHLRAGDRQQVEKVLRHASTLDIRQITVLVQEKRSGEVDVHEAHSSLGAARQIALQLIEIPPAAMERLARDVARSDTQAVLVIGSPATTARMLSSLRREGGPRYLYGLSYLPPELLVAVAGKEAARGVALAQVYPNPMGYTKPLHQEFRAAMRALMPQLPTYSSAHLEGYLTARATIEGLRRVRGSIHAKSLADALRNGGPMDLGGFKLDFSRSNVGSHAVDIGVIDAVGRLLY